MKRLISWIMVAVMIVGFVPMMGMKEVKADSTAVEFDLLTDNLFYNADCYNNDLAAASARLCYEVGDLSTYFPTQQLSEYSWETDSNVFRFDIGYKTIETDGTKKNLVAIVFRGTGSLFE